MRASSAPPTWNLKCSVAGTRAQPKNSNAAAAADAAIPCSHSLCVSHEPINCMTYFRINHLCVRSCTMCEWTLARTNENLSRPCSRCIYGGARNWYYFVVRACVGDGDGGGWEWQQVTCGRVAAPGSCRLKGIISRATHDWVDICVLCVCVCLFYFRNHNKSLTFYVCSRERERAFKATSCLVRRWVFFCVVGCG